MPLLLGLTSVRVVIAFAPREAISAVREAV